MSKPALGDVRVIEMGQLIAGPFCGKILADFGAEVIKIEPPGLGDPLRRWRLLKDDTSLWWETQSRGKRSIALDLRTPEGQQIARRLIATADVVVENFRPGTLESWGLGWPQLSESNPGLILLRVSGFGQDGPYRDRPGFGAVAEAIGGLRYLTGEPGRVPVRTGVSIGDTLAALHGAIGVLIALHQRKCNGGLGQVVDVALYESVFNCMDSLLAEYSAFEFVRQPAGSALPGVAPSNAYQCIDGTLLIAGNGDSIFKRLMQLIGRNDLAEDSTLATNDGRVANAERIDAAIADWTRARTLTTALESLERVDVPASSIYSARDIAQDPHFRARGMIQRSRTRTGYELDLPGIVPKLSLTPGAHWRAAPELGADTVEVLSRIGLGTEALADLSARGVIGKL